MLPSTVDIDLNKGTQKEVRDAKGMTRLKSSILADDGFRQLEFARYLP